MPKGTDVPSGSHVDDSHDMIGTGEGQEPVVAAEDVARSGFFRRLFGG